MAIIECPECKLKISDTAVSCPRCGFTKHRKSKAPIVIIILLICIILLLGGLLVISCMNTVDAATNDIAENETETFLLDSNSADPYGLAGENNIIGKDIKDILNDYTEGVDYVCEKTDSGYEYKFSKDIYYPIGEDITITMCTEPTSYEITIVYYTFYIPNGDLNTISSRIGLEEIIQHITDYYDTDPEYFVYNGGDFITITKDQFKNSLFREDKVFYYIAWETNSLDIIFEIPNIYQDKKIDCNVIFADSTYAEAEIHYD